MKRTTISILILLSLMGCSSLNESSYKEKVEQDLSELNLKEVKITNKKLTDLFENKELEYIIEQSLLKNPDVNSAIIALRISELQKRQALSEALPKVDASFSATNKENSGDSYSSSISVAWELDIWGKLTDATKIATKTLEYNQYELENIKSILVSDIIREWVSLNLYDKYIKIEENRIVSLEKSKLFIIQRYSKGIGNISDLDNIDRNIYSAKSKLESYITTRNQNQRALNVLIGDKNINNYLAKDEDFLNVFSTIDLLGLQNLSNRPDLQMAYNQIEINDLSTNIAYKNMLPSLSLSAAISDTAEKPLDSLLTSPLWSLLGQLTMPLFESGNLKAEAQIAELETEKAYLNYQQVLLNATKEVNDYVELERTLSVRQGHIEKSLELSIKIEQLDKDKYSKGLIKVSDYLTSQRSVYDLQEELNSIIKERIENRINLGLSLGLGV